MVSSNGGVRGQSAYAASPVKRDRATKAEMEERASFIDYAVEHLVRAA
jgi:hypothetical protein